MNNVAIYGLGITFFGKGGFLDRLWQVAKKAIGFSPIGAAILAIGDELFGGSNGNSSYNTGKLDSDEIAQLSQAEFKLIDDWDLKYFTPFFLALMQEAKIVFDGNLSIASQLDKVNVILNKICGVKSHYITNPTNLSANGFKVRTNYIARSFFPIEQFILDQFGNNPKIKIESVQIPFISLQLSSIITSSSVKTINCNNYKAISNDVPMVTTGTVVLYDNIPEQTQLPTNTNTGVNNPEDKKSTSYVVPVIAVGLIITAIAISSKDE